MRNGYKHDVEWQQCNHPNFCPCTHDSSIEDESNFGFTVSQVYEPRGADHLVLTPQHIRTREDQRHNSLLTKLPPELRRMIFKELLVFHQPFDLAPLSVKPNSNGYLRVKSQKRLRGIWRECVQPLRVDKMIWFEATDIFFGRNEFRFSSVIGWRDMASFFALFKSYLSSIRNLAVHISCEGLDLSSTSDLGTSEHTINMYMQDSPQGLPDPNLFRPPYGEDPEMLTSLINLRNLKLILPPDYRVCANAIPPSVIFEIFKKKYPDFKPTGDSCSKAMEILASLRSKNRHLNITLVDLQKQRRWDDVSQLVAHLPPGLCDDDPLNHYPLHVAAVKYGWELSKQYYNDRGEYPVAPEDETT
ncbi:MAG: hypothetical protein M1822_008850 [Bathelium mastoideum]|nr:MAG: hypothetical protein M1822_008850 [Bathelium mastoideum]